MRNGEWEESNEQWIRRWLQWWVWKERNTMRSGEWASLCSWPRDFYGNKIYCNWCSESREDKCIIVNCSLQKRGDWSNHCHCTLLPLHTQLACLRVKGRSLRSCHYTPPTTPPFAHYIPHPASLDPSHSPHFPVPHTTPIPLYLHSSVTYGLTGI